MRCREGLKELWHPVTLPSKFINPGTVSWPPTVAVLVLISFDHNTRYW